MRGGLVSFNQLAVTGPHTPRWLVQQGRDDEARAVLERLRANDPEADVDQELADIHEASEQEGSTAVRDLASARVRPLLVIGLGLALFQQFVGINTVIYYAPTILADTGLTKSASITQTVFVGITNVVFTVIAVLLLDRVGRRKLLLTGTVGLVVSLAVLGVYFTSSTLQQRAGWLALVALLVFIASFAIGFGPVFWLMISEIFPVGIRSKAMSVSTVANWGGNFLVAATFLSLASAARSPGRGPSTSTPASRPWRSYSSSSRFPRPRTGPWRTSRRTSRPRGVHDRGRDRRGRRRCLPGPPWTRRCSTR